MKLITIGSSSAGNGYLIENNGHFLALECGCRWKDVSVACGFNVSVIDCALISHEHGDHAGFYKDYCRNGIPCYSNESTARKLTENSRTKVFPLTENKWGNAYGGYKVLPIYVPHEDIQNSGFIIEFPTHERLAFFTDFEYIPHTFRSFGINYWMLACNHIDGEVDAEKENYSHVMLGHSSLSVVKEIVKLNATESTKGIFLTHLSDSVSDEEILVKEVESVSNGVPVKICKKGSVFEL